MSSALTHLSYIRVSMTGVEPATSGALLRCSSAELHRPAIHDCPIGASGRPRHTQGPLRGPSAPAGHAEPGPWRRCLKYQRNEARQPNRGCRLLPMSGMDSSSVLPSVRFAWCRGKTRVGHAASGPGSAQVWLITAYERSVRHCCRPLLRVVLPKKGASHTPNHENESTCIHSCNI